MTLKFHLNNMSLKKLDIPCDSVDETEKVIKGTTSSVYLIFFMQNIYAHFLLYFIKPCIVDIFLFQINIIILSPKHSYT